jgi:phenylacetate-CoA ligase
MKGGILMAKDKYPDYEAELKKLETMSEDKLRELQFKKLKKQLKYCYETSPFFYKTRFDAIGVKPEDIRTWDDFRNLPLYISKIDEKEAQEESLKRYNHPFGTNLCTPIEKVILLHSTTGTTGEPTFPYVYTQKDSERHHQTAGRHYWKIGLRPGERVLYAAGAANMAGLKIYEYALRYYGCLPLTVGAEAGTERILRIMDITKPTTLFATPPLIEYLIEACPKVLKKDVKEFKLKRLIGSGSPGAGIPATKKKIEEAYQCRLYDSFGGCFAVSCDVDEYQGMHLYCRDFVIFMEDMVDPQTKKPIKDIKDGTIGEVRLTNLEWEGRPFLKYSQGDIYQVFTKKCICGWDTPRVKILGRLDDMLIIKGVNVYPAAIKNVVSSFEPRTTGEIRVVLDQPPPAVPPPMKIKVEYGPDIQTEEQKKTLAQELEEALHVQLKFRAAIELIPTGSLERAAGPGAKGKLIEKTYENK